MTGHGPTTDTQILHETEELIRRAFPGDWTVTAIREPGSGRTPASTLLALGAPGGEQATFVIKVKHSRGAQVLLSAVGPLARSADLTEGGALPLVVAASLSPRSKQVLVERGVSYADATGTCGSRPNGRASSST